MASTPLSDGSRADSTPFACRWRLEGRSAASVRVAGELDLATAPQLETALQEALVYARLVLLDVSGLSFMDSSGLRVILDASVGARAQGAHVLVVGISEQVDAMLDITRTRPLIDLLSLDRDPEPSRAGTDLLDAVTGEMAALHLRYHGRIPATAKTVMLDDDTLACVLGTGAEETMLRRESRAATRHAFIKAVQRLSGRPVTGFISDYHVGPDIAVELFLLDPPMQHPSM